MVDPINLMLLKKGIDGHIQFTGRIEISPKRLFDNDLRMVGLAQMTAGQSGYSQIAQDRGKYRGWRGYIKQHLHVPSDLLFNRFNMPGQSLKCRSFVVAPGYISRVGRYAAPNFPVEFTTGKFHNRSRGQIAELLIGDVLATKSDQVKIRGQ